MQTQISKRIVVEIYRGFDVLAHDRGYQIGKCGNLPTLDVFTDIVSAYRAIDGYRGVFSQWLSQGRYVVI